MKKTFFCLYIILLLGACSNEFDDITYTINNNSSIAVSFFFYDDTPHILNIEESASFIINSSQGAFAPEIISGTEHEKSIKLNRENLGTSGIIYSFTDNPRFVLDVINTLSVPVTIGESGGYIDNNKENTLTINENDNETAFIYTSKPNFTLISDPYPVIFDWKFADDTVYLVIR